MGITMLCINGTEEVQKRECKQIQTNINLLKIVRVRAMRRDERQLDGRNLAYRIDAVSKYNTLMMIDNVL